MSHFSRIKSRMTNEAAIVAALEEMGYQVQIHENPIKMDSDFSSENKEATIVVSLFQQKLYVGRYRKSKIGFAKGEDGVYEMIADTWFDEAQTVLGAIPALYAKHVVIQQAQALGHPYTVQERMENGEFAGYSIEVEVGLDPNLVGKSSVSRLLIGGY